MDNKNTILCGVTCKGCKRVLNCESADEYYVNLIKEDIATQLLRTFEICKLEGKSPYERALKLSEECGEVSEAVLSYFKACGCSYKGKTRKDIAEECLDVIIVALSILDSVGYGVERDILDLYFSKLNKWESKCKESR